MTDELIVLILAAGQGTRFSASGGAGAKVHARLGEQTLLEHTQHAVNLAGLKAFVVHPQGALTQGMGDSIAYGVDATQNAGGWLILPADMPSVQPATIRAVALHLLNHPQVLAVAPYYQGRRGHPVAFAAACREALQALKGDSGARSLLQSLYQQQQVLDLPVEDSGIHLDIDTLDALKQAQRQLKQPHLIN